MSYPLTRRVCMQGLAMMEKKRERRHHHFTECVGCPVRGPIQRRDLTHSYTRHNITRYSQAEQEAHMPVAKVYVPEGTLTPEQRREIVKGIHDVIVGVEKRPADSPTYVLINEIPAGDWGATGNVYVPRT